MSGLPVLVTGGEQVAGLATVRGLRLGGWQPYVVTFERLAPAAWSRDAAGRLSAPNPELEPKGFADSLAAEAHRLGAVAILPGNEQALLAVAEHSARFPANVALGAAPIDAVSLATDKARLTDLAGAAGLGTPPTRLAGHSDWKRILEEIGLPAVIKPRRSVVETPGGRMWVGARRADTAAELRASLNGFPGGSALVQPFLPGRMVTVNGVCWNGATVCSIHQVADRLWPLDLGVLAYARTVAPDPELDRRVARLMEGVGWSGLFNLQFISHRDELHLIDLNPRPYHSLALAIAAGLNLPAIWMELLLGGSPSIPPYRVGVRFRAEGEDARALMALLKRGSRRAVLRGLRPHRQTTHALLARGDPLPAMLAITRWGAQRVARLARTNKSAR
jgi:predicted ATP-grasp superfamily ATP-dependent carboligase